MVVAPGVSTPASAQVSVYGGDNGVAVRIGPRRHHREYYSYGAADCRTVTVRTKRPDGSVVVRKTRRCD
jgi:hypothetical protein